MQIQMPNSFVLVLVLSSKCSMIKGGLKYYILFENYEQRLALHDVLDSDDIPNRIAPAPRAIQGELSCGMSLLIEPAHIEQVRLSIEKHQAEYHTIVPLEGQVKPKRDKYC